MGLLIFKPSPFLFFQISVIFHFSQKLCFTPHFHNILGCSTYFYMLQSSLKLYRKVFFGKSFCFVTTEKADIALVFDEKKNGCQWNFEKRKTPIILKSTAPS